MLKRNFIRQHKVSFAIILFILSLTFIHTTKPNFLYKKDDTFREFGLGYLKKNSITYLVNSYCNCYIMLFIRIILFKLS